MQTCQEAIIILHGWQSSKEKWQKVKENLEQICGGPSSANLAEDGLPQSRQIKVIIPDLPGFKKETELSRAWNLDDYVEWLKSFFEEQCETRPRTSLCEVGSRTKSAKPFFLLGHSFGGRIAIKFAAKYPEKLKGLILVSSAGIKLRKPVFRNFTEDGLPSALISVSAQIGRKFSFLPFYSFFRKIFYKYILRKTDYIKAEKIPHLKETFKNVVAEDLTAYLSQIKVPTLIIWSEKDKMTPISDAYLMNEKIPNSKLEILKNVGHVPHLEAPEILAPKIVNFIKT